MSEAGVRARNPSRAGKARRDRYAPAPRAAGTTSPAGAASGCSSAFRRRPAVHCGCRQPAGDRPSAGHGPAARWLSGSAASSVQTCRRCPLPGRCLPGVHPNTPAHGVRAGVGRCGRVSSAVGRGVSRGTPAGRRNSAGDRRRRAAPGRRAAPDSDRRQRPWRDDVRVAPGHCRPRWRCSDTRRRVARRAHRAAHRHLPSTAHNARQ